MQNHTRPRGIGAKKFCSSPCVETLSSRAFVRTRRYMHKSQGASGTLRGISVPKISLGEACWRGSEKSCVDLWKSGIGAKAENICSWRAFPLLTLSGSRACWRAIAVSQNSVSQNIYYCVSRMASLSHYLLVGPSERSGFKAGSRPGKARSRTPN
jgi:hypothetical protein